MVQSLKKSVSVVLNMAGISVRPTTQKSENLNSMASFCPKYNGFRLKKDRGVTFHDTKQ